MHFLASFSYDVVTRDLMMPRMDGWTVLRQLRDRPERPRVLVLPARGQVEDRVEVLNLGADDFIFIVKPFAYAELLARLHALMRRGDSAPVLLKAGRLVVDPRARRPRRWRAAGAVAEGVRATGDVIEVLVSTLRTKLAQAGVEEMIETRRGFGYVVAPTGG